MMRTIAGSGWRAARTALGAGVVVAWLASPAAADEVSGTRSDKLVEQSHRATLTFDRGHAELVVRRTLFNGGARVDQAVFFLSMPPRAVATGLRTLGIVDGEPRWFRGDLMEAEAAAAKYRELTGIGGAYPKDPALLSWKNQSLLELQVFPVPIGQPKTVEYTLEIPTAYKDGRDRLELPRLGTAELGAQVVLHAARPGDRLFVGDKPVSDGAVISFRKDDEAVEIALARAAQPTLDGALASVRFAKGRNLVRWRLEAAAKVSSVPRRAHIVVVLDGSRSVSEAEERAEIAAARAYLGHFSDAKAQVLTYDREVQARHGGFVSVDRAIADLGTLEITRRNGSRIDDALARADALLAALPAGTPRRILALTDLRTRTQLDPARLHAIQKSGAVLHVGVVELGTPKLQRDDEDPWAKPARATGGLLWRATASAEAADRTEMRRVYEEWARPLRLDHVKVRAPGIEADSIQPPETLDEGQAIEELRTEEKAVASVELTGELWSQVVRKVVTPDEAEGKLWAAAVFGSELLGGLTEPEMMTLARKGEVVSPVTSFLAIEPGVRPSTEGLELSGIGEGGGGRGEGIGLGSIGTIGHGSGVSFDHAGFLKGALAPGWKACTGKKVAAKIEIETTLDEIVDLPSIAISGDDSGKLRECLARAAWEVNLPRDFAAAQETFKIEL